MSAIHLKGNGKPNQPNPLKTTQPENCPTCKQYSENEVNLLIPGFRRCNACGKAWKKELKEGHCSKCNKDLGKKKGMYLPFDSVCSECLNEWMNEQQRGKTYTCDKCKIEGTYNWVRKHMKKMAHRSFQLTGTKEGLMFV